MLLSFLKTAFILALISLPLLGHWYSSLGGRHRGFGDRVNSAGDGFVQSGILLFLWGVVALLVMIIHGRYAPENNKEGMGLAANLYLIALSIGNLMAYFSAIETLIGIGKASSKRRDEYRQRARAEEARLRQQADVEAARLTALQAERQREIAQREANRKKAVGEVASLVSAAQEAAAHLPILLGRAEFALDHAERELADNVPSSFWEAMETAAQHLSEFDSAMQSIDIARKQHTLLAPPLKPDAIDFTLGVSVLPDASHTGHRMNQLYRHAQKTKEGNFAVIYEQRRNTSTLIHGFRSLGEAFSQMGARLEAALSSLGDQLDFRLSDIESALRESAVSMGEQQTALLRVAELARQEAAQANSDFSISARESADRAEHAATNRKKYEQDALRMLDNLQRRRKPDNPRIGDNAY